MSDKDYYSEQLLTTSININSDSIKGDINQLLFHKLKQKYEGVCNKDGYVKKDSIEIVDRSIGEVKTINNTSYIVYNITYKAGVLSPVEGIKLDIVIDSITKMGIIGYIKFDESDTIEDSPFIIIVPKEYFDDNSFEKHSVKDILQVVIIASRIKYLSKNIQIVGKPL